MTRRRIPKNAARIIAGERIERLFAMSEEEMAKGNADRAKRYVELAERIGMRYKVSISFWKRRFCPECKTYFKFPETASVRLRKGRIIITCVKCGNISRYPFKI